MTKNAEEKRISNINKVSLAGNKRTLEKAKEKKDDEYYTRLEDIERELKHYKGKFKDKVIFLNCDDPSWSNFWKYFYNQFEYLGLKKLISTHYSKKGKSYALVAFKEKGKVLSQEIAIESNGDFRAEDSLEYLRESDIIVTNPPFSLFTEFFRMLLNYKKKFIIIAPTTSLGNKDVAAEFVKNKLFVGVSGRPEKFIKLVDGNIKFDKAPTIWLTNIKTSDKPKLILTTDFKEAEKNYKKYLNYEAINVNRTKDIPANYYGEMGVPITFLEKYNPDQFEIIRYRKGNDGKDLTVENEPPRQRYIIRRKQWK